MKNRYFAVLTCLLLFIIVSGCNQNRGQIPSPPAVPRRIISVVPAVTEMLFALGVGDRVIAVGDYDRFPPEVQALPRIGGLLNPNIEKIIEMKPDLVITYGTQDVLRQRLIAVGIRMEPFSHGSIDRTLHYLVDLGKTVGQEARGREITTKIQDVFNDLRRTAPPRRPTVLLVDSRETGMLGSFYTIGSKGFQNDLIEIAGGRNIFADVDQDGLQPILEEVIRRAPEIIIETIGSAADPQDIEQRRKDWQQLDKIPAVANHRVYVVAADYMLIPGIRLDQAAKKFAELIRTAPPARQ